MAIKQPKINPPPEPEIDPYGGRHIEGTRIIKHIRTGDDVQEEWEKDHGNLDDPTYLRNRQTPTSEKE